MNEYVSLFILVTYCVPDMSLDLRDGSPTDINLHSMGVPLTSGAMGVSSTQCPVGAPQRTQWGSHAHYVCAGSPTTRTMGVPWPSC